MDALTATIKELGGKPVKAPASTSATRSPARTAFLKTAQTFEDTGVGAYNGAGPQIKSKEVLARGRLDRAGRGTPRGGDPAAARRADPRPSAFDKALEKQAVLDAVKPFVKS